MDMTSSHAALSALEQAEAFFQQGLEVIREAKDVIRESPVCNDEGDVVPLADTDRFRLPGPRQGENR